MQTEHTIITCREGYEQILREEMIARGAIREPVGTENATVTSDAGLIVLDSRAAALFAGRPVEPFIFELQRMENAIRLDDQPLKATARAIVVRLLPSIAVQTRPWTIHAFASNPNGARPLTQHADSIRRAVLDFCSERFTAVFRRYRDPGGFSAHDQFLVLQVCAAPGGLWGAVTPSGRLSDPMPGGVHRMRFDRQAPSRSYLKIEEVFERCGEAPRPLQRVVDLGAAPGGWSYAFLKRGCRVLAVDNGPLKLVNTGWANTNLTHLRENGISFKPPDAWIPLDWMISDMLIAPGQTLGMLRKWFAHGWMRRFVFNIKLPQTHPYQVIKPIEDYLHEQKGVEFHIRQLYHDRREVTAFGRRV